MTQRIQSLDVIRGFALLGILIMNIQSFSMPSAAYLNPYAYGDMQGINFWTWAISHIFADQKFMSLFSMLFGVGVLIFCAQAEKKGLRPWSLHMRRNFVLLAFGLIHGYLFWYGDILFSYAICSLLVYWFRNKSIPVLVTLSLVMLVIGSSIYLLMGFGLQFVPTEELGDVTKSWQPDAEHIGKEIAAYTGGLISGVAFRAEETFFMQSFVFPILFFWRATGMMLLGMALFKSGFFSGKWSAKSYWLLTLLGSTLGFAAILYGLSFNLAAEFKLQSSMFIGSQFNYWGSALVALAYASIIMLIMHSRRFAKTKSALANVGRMALSNYILQTLIGTTLFYHLGLLGEVARYQLPLFVMAIWMLQIWLSNWYLGRFQQGPLEKLWRNLTYARSPVASTSSQSA